MECIQSVYPALRIDSQSDVPVVRQITSGLRQYLVDGKLEPGHRLPSSRVLARDLGIHFNTVVQAYRELECEGWLSLRRRIGTVVMSRDPPQPDRQHRRELTTAFGRALRDLVTDYQAQGLDRDAMAESAADLIKGK